MYTDIVCLCSCLWCMFSLCVCVCVCVCAGKEPMSATLPIRPGYPTLPTLDSLFSEGPVSFAKLAAEASRKTDEPAHTFDFGVTMEESDNGLQAVSRKRLATFMEADEETVQRLMQREFAKNRERSVRRVDKKKKPAIVKKLAERLKAKASSSSSGGAGSGGAGVGTDTQTEETKPVDSESTPSETPPTTTTTTTTPTPPDSSTTSSSLAAEARSKARKTARDKFRHCEKCSQEIQERIHLCAGCKKVAYCNNQCQKSHWKQHKKTCSYIIQKTSEREKTARTCGSCDRALSDRILFCAGCKKVPYCNSTCQKAHWKEHKKMCSYSKKDTETAA